MSPLCFQVKREDELVLLVGGGAFLVDQCVPLRGASRVITPKKYSVRVQLANYKAHTHTHTHTHMHMHTHTRTHIPHHTPHHIHHTTYTTPHTDQHSSSALLASYPGLLTPAFVTCSTNAGKGLVNLSHVVWRTWMSGGVAHSFCTSVKQLSESKKCRQDCLMSSAQSFCGPCLQLIVHWLICCFSRNVPLLHTSRYVIPHDSVLPGLPPC